MAQGLALMGCRPTWITVTGRVPRRRKEVLPCAAIGRPTHRRWNVGASRGCSGICFRCSSLCSMPSWKEAGGRGRAERTRTQEKPAGPRCGGARKWRRRACSGTRLLEQRPGAYGAGRSKALIGPKTGDRDAHRRRLSGCRVACLWRAPPGEGRAFARRIYRTLSQPPTPAGASRR